MTFNSTRSTCARLLPLFLLTLSCDDGTTPVTPTESNLDMDRAVEETIGAAGGSLEVTDAGGTVYRLDVPTDALESSVTVVATPFKAAQTGNDMTPLGLGIRLQPDGLTFDVPATIVTTLLAPPASGTPLLLHRVGSQLGELLLAVVDQAVLTTEINHFSDVTPVSATVKQITDHWNMLMAEFEAGGASSDIAFQLGYTFVTFFTADIEGIPIEAWESDLNGVLSALIVKAVDNCESGECTQGSNQLIVASNIALGINNLSLYESAESQKPLCDTGALEVAIEFGDTIEAGVPSSLDVSVTQGEVAVDGASVSVSVSGGSASIGAGTTGPDGGFSTSVSWDGVSASVVATVTASHPGCPSSGSANATATPMGGPGGILVDSRDSEINVIASASYNLNPGGGSATVVYDQWAFVENDDKSGKFSSDTTRAGDGEGGGMMMSGSATASQVSTVSASGSSVAISFMGDVSGSASLSSPPGGDAHWQSYSAAFSDMDVTLSVFGNVSFQLSGTIDSGTDFSFEGEGVSICYEAGEPCPASSEGLAQPRRGLSESGTLIGDPDGGNTYRLSVRVERRLFYQNDSEPSSGSGDYSGSASVTMTAGP